MNKNSLQKIENEAKAAELLNSYMTNENFDLHHSAMMQGYVKRSTGGYVEAYQGRYGNGVIVHIPDFSGTKYHHVYYFIEKLTID